MPTPLEDLCARIKNREVLAIVGTGVSTAATAGNKLASWRGLMVDGIERCEQVCPELPGGWSDRMRAQIDHGDTTDLLCAAENISQRLRAPDSGNFHQWLEETVGELKVVDGDLIDALVNLGVPIATTNYDGLIEEQTGLKEITWKQRRRAESFARGRSEGVLHLHGFWDDPQTVVMGIRSYEAVLRDEHAQNLLHAMRTLKTLLFVGFGEGLADPNFGGLMQWAERVFHQSGFHHYRLSTEDMLPVYRKQHPPGDQVLLLPFGKNHSDLAPFLRSLI